MLLVPLLLPLCQLAPDQASPLAVLQLELSLLSLPATVLVRALFSVSIFSFWAWLLM